jgi:murein DD-endopeptidase MepM/ murein hydrolase activator NlpD
MRLPVKHHLFMGLAILALATSAAAESPVLSAFALESVLEGLVQHSAPQSTEAPDWFTQGDFDWKNLKYTYVLPNPDTAKYGPLFSPLLEPAAVTSHFGPRIPPLVGASAMHLALDLVAPMRTRVYAAYPGVIVASSDNKIYRAFPEALLGLQTKANAHWVDEKMAKNPQWRPWMDGPFDKGCGNFIVEGILPTWNPTKTYYLNGTQGDWDWGGFILYCHLDEPTWPIWRGLVTINDPIGLSGKSGVATGPHLHVAIYLNSSYLATELKKACVVNAGAHLDGTCPVDPSRLLFQRSLIHN